MRIHIIACRVLTRELNLLSAQSKQIVDISYLPQGLHETPDFLRARVQKCIDEVEADVADKRLKFRPDVICLGYGLCSNGTVGLVSGSIPLVIPRTDDCIALFLGSQARYLELFKKYNGTYWLNNGWIEAVYGSAQAQREIRAEKLKEYTEKYDEDNAEFLLEEEDRWIRNYNTCAFIASGTCPRPAYLDVARGMAEENNWQFTALDGNERMLKCIAEGDFPEAEFLHVPPHHRVERAFDSRIFTAVPAESGVGEQSADGAPVQALADDV